RRSAVWLIYARFEERVPVVRTHCRERRFNISSSVWLDDWLSVTLSKKTAQKIVERMQSIRLFANDGVDAQPDQSPFLVIILAAAKHRPCSVDVSYDPILRGGINQSHRRSRGLMREQGSPIRKRAPGVTGVIETSTRREQIPDVLVQTFVHPQQRSPLGSLIVVLRVHFSGPPVLTHPGMRLFV